MEELGFSELGTAGGEETLSGNYSSETIEVTLKLEKMDELDSSLGRLDESIYRTKVEERLLNSDNSKLALHVSWTRNPHPNFTSGKTLDLFVS